MPPRAPRRGDWYYSRGPSSRVVLKFYGFPPSVGVESRVLPEFRVAPGSYIGPVHEVEETPRFQSVLVPHPLVGELVWLNVWRNFDDGSGVEYALRVSDATLQEWAERGWVDQYLDEQPRAAG